MCSTCDTAKERARVWAAEVKRREAALTFAKQKEAEERARFADHAAQHPYRFEGEY